MTDIKKMLKMNHALLRKHRDNADLWITRARLLMLEDEPLSGSLREVERCIQKALELAPDDLDAIEEAAHFYDIIVPNRRKASTYAKRYIQLSSRVISDMRVIVAKP